MEVDKIIYAIFSKVSIFFFRYSISLQSTGNYIDKWTITLRIQMKIRSIITIDGVNGYHQQIHFATNVKTCQNQCST